MRKGWEKDRVIIRTKSSFLSNVRVTPWERDQGFILLILIKYTKKIEQTRDAPTDCVPKVETKWIQFESGLFLVRNEFL